MALVLVALLLVALVVFTAFAVDIGAVYAERRQDQTAADVAALAAAQDLRNGEATMVATATSYAHDALGGSLPDGADGWNGCPRPDPAALARQAASASCISYEGTRVRVRLPDQFHPAGFGRVVGIDDYRHSAFAVAGLEPVGFGGVLPFFATDAQVAAGYECLIADGPSDCVNITGSFAPLVFSYHSPSCTIVGNRSQEMVMLENNAASGIDHDVSTVGGVPHGSTIVRDTSPGCPATPNAAWTIQGNPHEHVRDGLLLGTGYRDGQDARLQRRVPGGPALPRTTAFGRDVDDTPLWWFIPPDYGPGEATPANIPTSCTRDQFVDSSGRYYANLSSNPDLAPAVAAHLAPRNERDRVLGLMVRCFKHYAGQPWNGAPGPALVPAEPPTGCTGACSAPVFALNSDPTEDPDLYDIQYTPRFGYSPQTSSVGSGLTTIQFQRFRAIYLNRITLGNNSVIWDPYTAPRPGAGASAIPNNTQTPVKAFFFPDAMLPGGLGGPDAAHAIGANRFVALLR